MALLGWWWAASSPGQSAEVVFAEDAEFRYFKGQAEASSPDTARWRTIGFNDSSWLQGRGPFFYEDSSGFSGNNALADMRHAYTCVYLRKTFAVAAPTAVAELTLALQTDDGCVAWLNGTEIGRVNMPDGDLAYTGVSLPASGEPNVATLVITNAAALLQPGANVIAVQAFNSSLGDSTDFLIAAALTSTRDLTAPTIVETVPSMGKTVRTLTQIEVLFSENVTGVEARDLRVNGTPATALKVYSPRDYAFDVPEPPVGEVTVSWAQDAGITDFGSPPNPFAGGSWTYTLDPTAPPADVFISEFMADNEHGVRDNFGERSDWIELLNRGPEPLDLTGWHLTDDRMNLAKWSFPAVTIGPNAYLMVWASSRNIAQPSTPLHTNFRLGTEGEYLALVNPEGKIVSEFAPTYPPQRSDISYGRDRTSPELTGYFATPTPGAANTTTGAGFAPDPVFSVPGGLFSVASLGVTLSAPSGMIRYTTDGTTPTSASPLYTGRLTISASTVVQARVFQEGMLPSAIGVHTYNLIGSGLAGFSSDLPLLVVNTSRRGIPQDSRIAVHVTAIDTVRGRAALATAPSLQGKAQMEIRGQSSTGFPKSAYNLELNDPAGNDLEAPLLGLPAESDWVLYNPYSDKPFLQNFLAFELHEKMGHYAPRRRFVEVFIDTSGGKLDYPADYAGIYILLEKIKVDGNRVDLARLTPEQNAQPEISGGYIIKKDKDSPGDLNFSTSGGGGFSGQALKYHEPKPREITQAQRSWIRTYLNQFEKAMYAANWLAATGTNHYSHYIDVDSFVDNHWIVEFPKQIDGYRLSNYMSKDRGGKLRMEPIWDWNLSFGNADYLGGWLTTGWYYTQLDENAHIWLRRLICGTTSPGGSSGDPDFNQKIIDRWSVLRTNLFAPSVLLPRIDELAASLDEAQVRDFQKWPRLGQYVWPNPTMYVTPTTYAGIIAALKSWVEARFNWIDSQFVRSPQLSHGDTAVSPGFVWTATGPTGTLFYTLDGTDPRAPGGATAPQAQAYSGGVTIQANSRVVARVRNGVRWSGPTAATFLVDTPPLVVSELMYHPPPPPTTSTNEASDFEYVELANVGGAPLDLRGFEFADGIQFSFSTGRVASLEPGARVLVVKNAAAFAQRYPQAANVAGEFQGTLANEGERLRLLGPRFETVHDFHYAPDWYPVTDGLGFALVVVDVQQPRAAWDRQEGWRAGNRCLGTPGEPEPAPVPISPVLVSEALSNPDPPLCDAIELENPNPHPVDVGGWFLSDDRLTPKHRIPSPTVIPAGGWVVFAGQDFEPSFSLGAMGDDVYLFSADAAGQLTGYQHGFGFGAASHGTSFGLYVTSEGREQFVAQSSPSLGEANRGPRVGPVVLSEIMYHPPDVLTNNAAWDNVEDEFIELCNVTAAPVPLHDPSAPTNSWSLRSAVRFPFPPSQVLAAGERVLVVSFDPSNATDASAFRGRYHLSPAVRLFGPYDGALANGAERLELVRPDTVSVSETNVVLAAVLVDQVAYTDASPWPVAADGLGFSLQRLEVAAYGNDPINWTASAPTPGGPAVPAAAPTITRQPVSRVVPPGTDVVLSVEASGPGPLQYQWRFDGQNLAGASASRLALTNLQSAQAGSYQVVVGTSAAAIVSEPAQLRLSTPPILLRQPVSIEVRAGQPVELAVVAMADSPLRYQWRRDGTPIPNATRPTLAFPSPEESNSGAYDVIVADDADAVTSGPADLRVVGDPIIVQQPSGAVAALGGTVTLGLAINPQTSLPIRYRWLRDGSPVVDRTLDAHVDFLTLTGLRLADAGGYAAFVSNAGALRDGLTSQTADLEVIETIDSDGDGLPDDYERAHGLDPHDPTDASSDADGDRALNREEYLAGTDPQDPASVLRVERIQATGIVTIRFPGVVNRGYTILFRERAGSGPWQTLELVPASGSTPTARLIEVIDPTASAPEQRFYRLSSPGLSAP